MSSNFIVSNVYDIMCSDVWTSPISSVGAVIFLDHFSHYLWVYPLKRKSDVFSKFVEFVTIIKNQFGITIKSI